MNSYCNPSDHKPFTPDWADDAIATGATHAQKRRINSPWFHPQHQPQNVKLYYRVVAFNGCGDGPPGPVFGIQFDPTLVGY